MPISDCDLAWLVGIWSRQNGRLIKWSAATSNFCAIRTLAKPRRVALLGKTLNWDHRSQISNLKSEISNLKSQISNLKSQISNLKSEISNLRSLAVNRLARRLA